MEHFLQNLRAFPPWEGMSFCLLWTASFIAAYIFWPKGREGRKWKAFAIGGAVAFLATTFLPFSNQKMAFVALVAAVVLLFRRGYAKFPANDRELREMLKGLWALLAKKEEPTPTPEPIPPPAPTPKPTPRR